MANISFALSRIERRRLGIGSIVRLVTSTHLQNNRGHQQ